MCFFAAVLALIPLDLMYTASCLVCCVCRDDAKGHATENAVSALGKALQHLTNMPESLGVADLWVQSLPLTLDAEEAKIAHKQLIGFIQNSDQR